MNEDYLFSRFIFSDELPNRHKEIRGVIFDIPEEEFLRIDHNRLLEYYKQKYEIVIPYFPESVENEIRVKKEEVDVDVSQDYNRAISDRRRPYYIRAPRLSFFIPFGGDCSFFYYRPSTYTLNPPQARIVKDELVISFIVLNQNEDSIKQKIQKVLSEIKGYLNRLNQDAEEFNSGLLDYISSIIKQRQDKISRETEFIASLGFPLMRRENAIPTFSLPKKQKKVEFPKAVHNKETERILNDADYENILDIIGNMSLVFERSPQTFKEMSEENIRQHFLVQLNGQYEGQATGETFNFKGKTDILVRVEGKNIFIAECKFWNGPESLSKAIDQLLEYAGWRDTKTALLVFNRNKDLSSVLQKIPEVMRKHSNFKREIAMNKATEFRYILHHKDDNERDIVLTILVFEVPK